MTKGMWHGLLAYIFWGLFPIFWRQLSGVESFQIIAHRIVWSFLFLVLVLVVLQKRRNEKFVFPAWTVLKIYITSSILIGINWFLYVWAVNSGHIVESSLGYFITPLLSVLFGVLFFKERMRPIQWISLGLAACGVLYLSFAIGAFPWIAISLAISFGLYGLVKKLAPLSPMIGLSLETGFLVLPSLAFLLMRAYSGSSAFMHQGLTTDLLLICAGLVTTLPLLLFASAARKIPLSMLGFLQYVSPSLQLFCGVFIYNEAFTSRQLMGYGFVWIGLLVFALDGYQAYAQNVVQRGKVVKQ